MLESLAGRQKELRAFDFYWFFFTSAFFAILALLSISGFFF